MRQDLLLFLLRRLGAAAVTVLLVASASLWLVALAPGDFVSDLEVTPEAAAAERARLGLDRPIAVQYAAWLARAARFDLGESLKYRRPVAELVGGRAWNTALLGLTALIVATLIGIPAGVATGSRPGSLPRAAGALSLLVLSIPPLVTAFLLLFVASRTGILPIGGFGALADAGMVDAARYLVLPSLALALPLAAVLERLQSQAMREALAQPAVRAAQGRGCSRTRAIWRHAMRLSLGPVIAVYGVLVGAVLSGSFVVEIVMAWPGLGALTHEALVSRDLHLVAGCAAAGTLLLAAGIFASDVALAAVDPRVSIRR